MKCILLIGLVATVSAGPFKVSMDHGLPVAPEYNSVSEPLNEIIDVVESGLSSEPEGRLLFIQKITTVTIYPSTVTLTSTKSVKAYCYQCVTGTTTTDITTTTTTAGTTTAGTTTAGTTTAGTTTAGTTTAGTTTAGTTTTTTTTAGTTTTTTTTTDVTLSTTTAAAGRALNMFLKRSDSRPTVTRSDGLPAKIEDILAPTPSLLQQHQDGRFDYDAFDGIITDNEPLESGTIEWNEMKVEGLSSCGRSGKRPRLLNLVTSTIRPTAALTMMSTVTATVTTVTFNIGSPCTTTGITIPRC